MIKQYEKYKDSKIKWIGAVPDSWWVSNIRYNAKIIGRIGYRGYTVEDIVDKGEGAISLSPSNIQNQAFDLSKRTYISWEKYEESPEIQIFEGDVILVKTASVGKVAYVDSLKGEKATINPQLVVFKDITMNSRFFYYYLISNDFQYQIDRDNYGGVVGTLTQASINSYKILVPSESEQTKIAQYLDHQTSIIDQLIKQKEKLIELLKEKRQAVINEAVTKGLYPNAKMKDSGIEWLGEVPKHWKVARIGHYTQLIRGASPRPAGDPRYFGGDFMPWITVGEVTNGDDKFVLSTENYLTKEGSEQSRIIYPETLLLSNSGATLGVPKISKLTGCINDGSVAFISLSNQLERDFLFYFFKTHTEIYRQEMSGYGQPNLNTDIIKSTKIPLPPISEQIEIVNFIENEFLEFDKIISLSALQIDKMKEYRQSIISEAVTGMIDVRDWQPNKQQVA